MNDLSNNEIIDSITNELSKLNFNFSYYGTRYLVDSIYETYNLHKIYNVNLSKEIFPKLSQKYNKSIDTIHSNIKKSVNIMYYDCDENVLMNYFYYDMIKKPSAKEIIIRILENIS